MSVINELIPIRSESTHKKVFLVTKLPDIPPGANITAGY